MLQNYGNQLDEALKFQGIAALVVKSIGETRSQFLPQNYQTISISFKGSLVKTVSKPFFRPPCFLFRMQVDTTTKSKLKYETGDSTQVTIKSHPRFKKSVDHELN